MIDVQLATIENVEPAARGSTSNRGGPLKGRTGHLLDNLASSVLFAKSRVSQAIRGHGRSHALSIPPSWSENCVFQGLRRRYGGAART
ncbi:hypothetical protein PV05_10378 [Exophiala xenobiotica]|uniref:Uncharacterized protein n=1 Tax=Exophiala xenobiotica TaxID=348802 RepID=A0A0D2EUX6_9EURO|nr:uncharacterized protein PV05_10378 [Exophiala xenobiotica]KIW51679.1 hypothetical protein PV05_10378 [Exophiala xenobiotica]